MNKQSANAIVSEALYLARVAHNNGGMSGFQHGYNLGMINVASNYLGADRWIADGARNEIHHYGMLGLKKGIR